MAVSITLVIFIVTFTLMFLFVRYRCFSGDSSPPIGDGNLPPGPVGWPILGYIPNILGMMMFRGMLVQDVFDELAKQFGPVYCMTLAGKRVVVANTFQTIREVLHHPDMNDRPSLAKPHTNLYQGTGVLYSSGDAWRDQRKFSLSVLRGFGVGKRTFEYQIAAEAGYLINEIQSLNESPFDPSELLTNAVSNVINLMTFGKRFEYSDPDFKSLVCLLDRRMENAGKELLVMSLPVLLRLPFGPGCEVKMVIGEIRQRLSDIVEDHRISHDPENIRDFIDAYLSEIHKNKDKEVESHFNNRNLVQTVEDLFLGGTQTTATTLRWALLYLIAFPSVQENIQQELDRVVGRNRLPNISDRHDLPYTLATIHEIQRYACITYILGVRATYSDTTIGGYRIPQRTALLQNIWSVSRDPSVWKDPLDFRPGRFLDAENHVIKREEQLAFGSGRRSCMGENIAKMELFIFLSHLLHRYTITKAKDSDSVNLKPKPGGVLKPFPYKIKAIERESLIKNLYV